MPAANTKAIHQNLIAAAGTKVIHQLPVLKRYVRICRLGYTAQIKGTNLNIKTGGYLRKLPNNTSPHFRLGYFTVASNKAYNVGYFFGISLI